MTSLGAGRSASHLMGREIIGHIRAATTQVSALSIIPRGPTVTLRQRTART